MHFTIGSVLILLLVMWVLGDLRPRSYGAPQRQETPAPPVVIPKRVAEKIAPATAAHIASSTKRTDGWRSL